MSLTLKQRGIHAYLACLLRQYPAIDISSTLVSGPSCLLWHYPSIDIFFRFEPAILSLTLKERRISVYLACLSWKYPSIDNFFRFKRVILSLALKERCIHLQLACLLWHHPWIDKFFRFKRLMRCILRTVYGKMGLISVQIVRIDKPL